MNFSAPHFSTLAVTTVTRIEQTGIFGKVRFHLALDQDEVPNLNPVRDNADGTVGFDVYAFPGTFTIGERVLMEVTFREILLDTEPTNERNTR